MIPTNFSEGLLGSGSSQRAPRCDDSEIVEVELEDSENAMDQTTKDETVDEVRPLKSNTNSKQPRKESANEKGTREWRNLIIRTSGELNRGLQYQNAMARHF